MRSLVDARFVAEAERASLRFACDDCAHFDDVHQRCAHGYPVAPHRPGPLKEVARREDSITFCKEFELGGGEDLRDASAGMRAPGGASEGQR